MNSPTSGRSARLRYTRLLQMCLLLCLVLSGSALNAQTRNTPGSIRTLFVAPSGSGSTAAALRERLIYRLKKSGAVRIVDNANSADAVLHCNTVLWPTGTVSPNPRSRSIVLTNYQGYLSAELTSASDQTLWSYLVTPGRFRMSNIVDDLADRLSLRLIAALKTGISTSSAAPVAEASPGISLRAAGSTFPAPLYRKWFESFAEEPGGFTISYDAIGSVGGLDQLADGKVDIGASDIPAEQNAAPGRPGLLSFPTIVGAVVPIYNLAGGGRPLNLTPQILADIYSGKIRKWNDSRIRQWNGGVRLPGKEIQVVHRSDGSGTTYAWTSFLAKASPEWQTKAGASIEWPMGIGAAGNEGVAEQVAKIPNSIGYVELTYAIQHQLAYAAVQNPSKRFIRADLDSITAAAAGARALRSSILDSPAENAYPITTFTWLIVPEANSNTQQRAAIGRFLRWMLTAGQKQCSALGYAPLPHEIVTQELHAVEALK